MIVMIVLGSILLTYIVTSVLLLRFPRILHKPKPSRIKCRHISHRGGAGENLENTIAAFKAAHEAGTEMFELDCQLTRDGHVVVSHDDHLERLTGLDIYITQTDYEDLPPLLEYLPIQFDAKRRVKGDDRRIPQLKELFELFPQTLMNIDLKDGTEAIIYKVSQLVEDYGREHLTVWGSKNYRSFKQCLNHNSRIATFVCFPRVALLVFSFYIGLLPFLPIAEDYYEIIMPSIVYKFELFQASTSCRMRVILRVLDTLLMSKVMFRHLQRRGLKVCLWVLNEDVEFKRALEYGVDGIMTDYPTKLVQYLHQHDTRSTS